MKNVILFLYRPMYAVFKMVLVAVQSKLNKKLNAWVGLRQQPTQLPIFKDRVIWLHASSGEIEYLKSFIREHKKLKPHVSIVVSYSSPSAPKLFDNIKSAVDFFFPLPWDQPAPLGLVIDHLKPEAFFFGRTDLWPELIYQLAHRGIKAYVIAYNPKLNFSNRLWSKIFLRSFSGIFCTHASQEAILKTLVPKTVGVVTTGDTRFDQVFWRLQQPSKVPFQIVSPYLVLGSTWHEDESVILPVLKQIKQLGFQVVWSPHEVELGNIQRIENILLQQNLTFEKLSDINSTHADVIIIDKIGYLADFYRLADAAFVGGSFKSRVHSVMEPLCCAIPVITGPKISNSPEALQYHNVIMNELRVVTVVQSSEEFLQVLKKIKGLQKSDFKKLLIGHLEKNRYATRKIMDLLPD